MISIRAFGFVLALGLPSALAAADAPKTDVAEVASNTFVRACAAHMGAMDELLAKLQPGRELFLPELKPEVAKTFLNNREGAAFIRADAGVTLALLTADDQCMVFVHKVSPDKLYRRLEMDLRRESGQFFAIRNGGQEARGPMTARFIDMIPAGEYRAELLKRFGTEPGGFRVIVTGSETANPNLQAIITIGTRQP
ncbi:conserved exported hypothetical protein [Candidatus Terasakiella magnetica]|nr:conserved exported hypothetical protein [Candidatus Terasakiella magnetica]